MSMLLGLNKRVVRLISGMFSVAFLCVCAVESRVFRGLRIAPEDQLSHAGLPWDHAYKANMTVNGVPSTLQLYSARFSEPVVDQLVGRFEAQGAQVQVKRSGEEATGVAQWPDRKATFFVLAPPSQPLKQIFVSYPDPSAKKQPVVFPVPELAGGRVINTVSDDDTQVFFATVETRQSSSEVHSFYLSALTGQGWSVVMPANVSGGMVSGMAVYKKKSKLCYVQSVDRMGKENVVTLLVKIGTH